MKQKLLFLTLLFTFSSWLSAATLTVDNSPGSVAMYTSVPSAVAAADPGDTILIGGSPNSYGGAHPIYKELHFVGVGWYLGVNGIPGLSNNEVLLHLDFKKDNSLGDSSGSSVTGCHGQYQSDSGVSGIVIDKCRSFSWNWNFIGQATVTRSNNRNVIWLRAANSHISNSIVGSLRLLTANNSATNCVVRTGLQECVTNTTITNTIFLEDVTWNGNPDFTYCLDIGLSRLPVGNGNINGVFLTDVFTLTGGDANHGRYYQLKEGSPAIGEGFGDVDMGAFGGSNPYHLSGVPGRPRMTRFNGPVTATGLTAVTIEVEAEAFPE